MKARGTILILFLLAAGALSYGILHRSFSTGDFSRTFEFSYVVRISDIPADAEEVSVIIPVPQSDEHQIISDVRIESDNPHVYLTDSEYGNKVARIELDRENIGREFEARMTFLANRKNYSALNGSMKVVDKLSEKMRRRFLSADMMIPLDGPVLDEERKVVRDGMSDLEKARAIYDDVVNTMTYDKSGTGWGLGDAVHACNARAGNCTDFHSLFIGMARAAGIPARFVIGFPIPEDKEEGEIGGYHCWAEFYTDELGWVPVDASEASKNPEKREFFFGNLDPNRVAFTVGRDITLEVEGLSDPLNYLIYPIVLVDGKRYDDVQKYFAFSDRKIERII
jgi:transglutaminase-like putative cysteine protease